MTVLSSESLAQIRSQSISYPLAQAYVSMRPVEVVAAGQINQSIFEERTATLKLDNLSGSWASIKKHYTVYVGTSEGASDVGVFRVRGNFTGGDTLPISEVNPGDSGARTLIQYRTLADNQHVTVIKDVGLWSIKSRIDFPEGGGTGTFYKDYDLAYTSQNENSVPCWMNMGAHAAGWVSGGVFSLTRTAEVFPFRGDAVLSYYWDLDGGSFVGGTAANDQTIEAEFTPGYYLISCTVTLDNGAVMTGFRQVHAHGVGVYEPYRVRRDISMRKTRLGTQITLSLQPDVRLDSTPLSHNTMVLYWETPTWDVPEATHLTPCWIQPGVSAVQTLRGLSQTSFTLVSSLDVVRTLPGVSQIMNLKAVPTTWQEATQALMNVEFFAFYLLYYHSTLLFLHDVQIQNLKGYAFNAWTAGVANVHSQVETFMARVNAYLNQKQDGTLVITRDPIIETESARNNRDEVVTWTESDLSQIDVQLNLRPTVAKVEGLGFGYDGSTPVPVRSMAYGSTGGQGASDQRIQDQLLQLAAQDELNERTGHFFADMNNRYSRIGLRLPRDWFPVIEPALMAWVRVDVPDIHWPEGMAFNHRCLINEITRSINSNGVISSAVSLLPETKGSPGRRMPLLLGNGKDDEDYEPPFLYDDDGFPEFDFDTNGFDDKPWTPYEPPEPPPPAAETAAITWGEQDILRTSSLTAPVWTSFFNETETVFSVLNNSASSNPLYLWALTEGGLYHTTNALLETPTWDLKQALSDGLLLRSPGANKIAVYGQGEVTVGAWTETFDFTSLTDLAPFQVFSESEEPYGGLKLVSGTWGILNATFGVDAAIGQSSGGFSKRIDMVFFCAEFTLTRFRAVFDFQGGLNDPLVNLRYNQSSVLQQVNNPPTANDQTIEWTGTQTGVKGLRFTAQTSFDSVSEINANTGSARLKSLTIEGTGLNPFTDGQQVVYSTNAGTSISTSVFGQRADSGAFDTDDFNLGVIIASAGTRLYNSTGYGDDSFARIPNIPFTNSITGTRPTVVRIPYRKLATQALNNSQTSLQFIFGTGNAIANPLENNRQETLWGVNFNATTRDPESVVVSNMTPVIGGTTYYVVGANALETAGANTQYILAFCKPIGGGATKLLLTTNGGTTWTIVNSFDGNFVKWIAGSTSRAWVSGVDGIGYTTNRGAAISDRTGDLAVEPRGVQLA